jgi:pyridine nucleotide-disulfide oxidoreductase family protein
MKRLVLIGAGHAHLFVLEALASARPSDVEVVLVTSSVFQNYSGMLPGWMAGHYEQKQCRIDLRPLARSANADLVSERMTGLDADRRRIELSDRRMMEYDLLSIDTGSETDISCLQTVGPKLLPIKPLDTFIQTWPQILSAARKAQKYRLIVVGGGAAAVELALAASHAFAHAAINSSIDLVASESGPLPDHAASVRRRIGQALSTAGILVHTLRGTGAQAGVRLSDGALLCADHVIAATGTRAPHWLDSCTLRLSEHGYIAVDHHNQSLSHPEVFAAGDICERGDLTLAHSGVHAVRTGPVLATNILAALQGGTMRTYQPRSRSLYLLACGPRYAIASWGRWSMEGRWVWRLKDWIDRRFIRRFSRPLY